MPVTLTDEQVAEIKRRLDQGERDAQVARASEEIWNDPKLSDRAKALWKEKFPQAKIADHDLKTEIFSRLDAEKKERDDEKKAAEERAATERLTSQKSDVQKRYALTDDAMERMEQEMNDKRVYDYEVMASHWVAKNPRPIEQTHSDHFWRHEKQDTFKEIAADPEKYAYDEIVKSLREQELRERNR